MNKVMIQHTTLRCGATHTEPSNSRCIVLDSVTHYKLPEQVAVERDNDNDVDNGLCPSSKYKVKKDKGRREKKIWSQNYALLEMRWAKVQVCRVSHGGSPRTFLFYLQTCRLLDCAVSRADTGKASTVLL